MLAGLLSFCYRTRSHTRLAAPLAPPSHTHLPPTLSPLSLSYPSARRVHVPAISAARAACRVTDSPPILSLAARRPPALSRRATSSAACCSPPCHLRYSHHPPTSPAACLLRQGADSLPPSAVARLCATSVRRPARCRPFFVRSAFLRNETTATPTTTYDAARHSCIFPSTLQVPAADIANALLTSAVRCCPSDTRPTARAKSQFLHTANV